MKINYKLFIFLYYLYVLRDLISSYKQRTRTTFKYIRITYRYLWQAIFYQDNPFCVAIEIASYNSADNNAVAYS